MLSIAYGFKFQFSKTIDTLFILVICKVLKISSTNYFVFEFWILFLNFSSTIGL